MRVHRGAIAKAAGCILAPLALCACVHPRLPDRPDWARFGNTSTATGGPTYHRDPHHQYFDRTRNRYYYYDPQSKRFFWENGEPKS